MNSKMIQDKLLAIQRELSALHARRDALMHEAEPLQTKRTAAVEVLDNGDGRKQREIIENIDKDLKERFLRVEGIDGKIKKAENERVKTADLLKETEDREKNELEAYLQRMEEQACLEMLKELPRYEQRIAEHFAALCENMTQFELASLRVGNRLNRSEYPSSEGLMGRIFKKVEAMGYRKLNIPATGGGQWWIEARTKSASFAPHTSVVFISELLAWQKEGDRVARKDEWKKERGL